MKVVLATVVALATSTAAIADTKTFICKDESWFGKLQFTLERTNYEHSSNPDPDDFFSLNSQKEHTYELREYPSGKVIASDTNSCFRRTISSQCSWFDDFDFSWNKGDIQFTVEANVSRKSDMQITIRQNDWSSSQGNHWDYIRDEEECKVKYYR